MLPSSKNRVTLATRIAWLALVAVLCFSAFHLWFYLNPSDISTSSSWTVHPPNSFSHTVSPSKDATREEKIPNIVHFVHISHASSTQLPLEFEFRQFIAIYSALYYLRPKTIYIHTNTAPNVIKLAKHSSNKWTRIIANLPTVKFNYETSPTETTSGVRIEKLPNQSDFVRTRVMKKWGGIYLDEDAYILKDLAGLRLSGYHHIVGRQMNGAIACGMWLSIPQSDLVTAYHALQDVVFNGSWSTHSVDLFTRVALEFSARENEVLILEQDAFFPLGWNSWHFKALYEVHDDDDPEITSSSNVEEFVRSFKMDYPATWVQDRRSSYVLHGFNSGIRHYRSLFREFDGITVDYVLARKSNFARAVYPAVKHAIDNGVI